MVNLRHVASGKVREIYELDSERLLFVATDRISAYDVILEDTIPDKGRILTGLSLHWFNLLDVDHHFLSTDLSDLNLSDEESSYLEGRSMIVTKADVIPVECVVRGYLYGSSWREYRDGGGPTTEHLPGGLRMADRLPEPIFTPATKAVEGHDENITEQQTRDLLGDNLYDELRATSLSIYETASAYGRERGMLLADTKFEFGMANGQLLLIDEVLTPDSSRYWPADQWTPGAAVPSFDKQFVRDWLDDAGWDHTPPSPHLPEAVIEATRTKYTEAFELITGHPLP